MRLLALLLAALPAWAADELTVYDLLAPTTHTFDIVYDVTATREGAPYFFNPIRPSPRTADDAQFLRVKLDRPVPKGAETRIRIYKTYTDPPSYYEKDNGLVFDRPLGIKRNVVILPKGYELVGSASPAIVSLEADGRIHVSFLNDRDDQLPVKIVGRKLP